MANNSIICGVAVDQKDYDGFATKRFEVPHDFKEGTRSLWQIEQFSKMSDYKKHYPEFAEACRKIVEREKSNIQSFYAGKTGRKEYVTMKHDDFTGYLKDLQEIQKSAAKERRELREQLDRAKGAWEEAQKDRTLSDYGRTAAKMKWLEADEAYKKSVADLRKRTDTDIESVREEFHKHIDDFYSANGDRIDEGTVRLLHSGISLTEAEINRLVENNLSNPTMLRVISDHCEKSKIDNKAAWIYGAYAKSAGKNEKSAFDQIVSMIDRVTGNDETMANVWSREESHFDRLSSETIDAIASLAVKPGLDE